MVKLWQCFKNLFVEQHDVCQKCHVRLQLTGEPPGNPSERLVKEVMGVSNDAPLHWLEEQLKDALSHEEFSHAWSLDAGIWGPTVLGREVAHILSDIRPEFASFIDEDDTISETIRPTVGAQTR